MASLKDIRRRILAVRNTQKVTRAMKLVAAAKLKRAQREAQQGRAYASGLHDVTERVSRRLGPGAPLMWRRPASLECIDLLLITSDRGLCGGFNENLIRAAEEGLEDLISHNMELKIFVIGRKGYEHLAGHGYDVESVSLEGGTEAMLDRIVTRLSDRYIKGESSGSNLAFNRFISAARQKITFWNLIPLHERGAEHERHLEYLYEPDRISALEALRVMATKNAIRQALLESYASELAARMTAMDAATKNADEMIAHLTSVYNRLRQETITSELLDIMNGADALR